jgi:archaetidylinositol phosphate synthase
MPLGRLERSRKRRHGTEVLCEFLFRPLAHLVVLALLPLRVPPPAVVLCAAATSPVAAVEVARGELVAAAILLQVKTVLDNADGQLARLSGRVSVLGRYLDAECDLLVNAALFAALGAVTREPLLAAVAFVVVTVVLGINFNAERLYRRERGDATDPMPPAEGPARVLERIYRIVYSPQDRLVDRFVEWRLTRAAADPARRLAYHDGWTVGVLANLGLSTQLAALGVCLALGAPAAYLWLVLGCGLGVVALAARRELSLRRSRPATAAAKS